MRTITPLEEWFFTRDEPSHTGGGPDASGTADETVTLPHAWNTSPGGVPADHDDRAPGWYRRSVDVPGDPAQRRVFLRFGAAGTVADLWCNGTHLGHHRGGYSAFTFDLTDALDGNGHGEIVVRADNSPTDDVYPLMGDHTIFGGLYRGASLVVVPPVHIEVADHGGPGVWTRVPSLDDDAATVTVHVRVVNPTTGTITPDVEVHVGDAAGREVAAGITAVEVDAGSVATATVDVTILAPRRWDGRADPHRYTVTAAVGDDTVTIPLGLREVHVDPDEGFFLNGRPYPLRGVARHHDIAGTPAVTADEIARDFDLIDEMGANAVRLAHYQHGETVLDECDRRGIVVWAEIPVNSLVSATDPLANASGQLTELIRQQRHHPSIVCWGLQNETVIGGATVDPRPTIAALATLAAHEDPDRATAQAQVTIVAPDDGINTLCDLNGVNLYHGWYLDRAENVGDALDAYRAAHPKVPLALSEYGADATTGYHSADPVAGDYTEEYQAIFHETYLARIDARPWLWATFVWNMFDFASTIRDEGGTRGFNMKGLVTRDRTVRKDAFFWYKANWSDEPVVHICSKRFVHRTGDTITVKVYANQPSVGLTVNGRDLGERHPEGRIATWEVPLGTSDTTVVATAGRAHDEATFHRVAAEDPAYVCPAPRRITGGARMDSWYEEHGIELDRSGWGFWSNLGELLDDPATRAVLVEFFGGAMLDHPQIGIARGFALEFVLGIAAPDLEPERIAELQTRLGAIRAPDG